MASSPKYYIVEASALPEVFLKVAETKRLLSTFAEKKANIITINSIVPTNGCAIVTISAETTDLTVPLEELLHLLRQHSGVIKAEILAG